MRAPISYYPRHHAYLDEARGRYSMAKIAIAILLLTNLGTAVALIQARTDYQDLQRFLGTIP